MFGLYTGYAFSDSLQHFHFLLSYSGQNKNNPMMAYLLWRVETGRHLSIEYNFLVAGHTKFSCDLCFGYLKKKTRLTKLNCLKDIEDVSTIMNYDNRASSC